MTDQEQMASLFVSDEGELRLEPDWLAAAGEEDWQDWLTGWAPIVVPEAVAAGILRLIRERDEARALLAEAWEWTTPRVYGKLGYVALRERVKAVLEAKEEPDGHGEPSGQ